ncbi:RagB/SusD family nutrient uptake outer membrane protein [Chitinophaga sp. 212800010-3]|uniref:RagB/SusD family nutrient uptake outer membrane protein n=1 Tax=unclassified Chitinophaga TaxID=2619133 RepID=UPI002DE78E03|nr:RagB/SusD family nutrient uptake outer membrane protein [Chitinophaga sp. 212800010-3]
MKRIAIITICVLGLVSCKKFLAERSQSDVIPRSTKDFGEILYSNGYPTVSTLMQPYITLMDDDVQSYNGNSLIDIQPAVTHNAGAYQWQPDFIDVCKAAGSSTTESFNSWTVYYQLILGTNVALQYLDGSDGSTAEKNMYKGEAYALRAFYYFMLVNLYGKPYNDSSTTPDKSPGVPLMLSANLSEALPARNSVKEVYDRVVKDLDSAMILLDQVKINRPSYRISNVAAHLLASRIYLHMEQWNKVIEHADYVLSYHPQLMDLNTWGDPDPVNKRIIGAGNVETIWYYGSNDEGFTEGMNTAYDISGSLAACFDSTDARTKVYFQETLPFLKQYTPCDYGSQKSWGSSGDATHTNMGSSWRSSEAYLNRAEAYIQLYKTKGDVSAATEALKSLNTLRAKRIDPASFANWGVRPPDELLQMCRTERRRELFRECTHRWFDLRRYGMPSITHIYAPTPTTRVIYKLAARDPQYVIPIPNKILIRNTALMQNLQLTGPRQGQ